MRYSKTRKLVCFALLVLLLIPLAACAGELNSASTAYPVNARLLTDREYFDVLQETIGSAQTEIVVCAYLFKTLPGAEGYPERIVKSLADAAKRGVDVVAVMELNQEGGDLAKTNAETAKRLEKAGIRICPDPQNVVTHTKLVIVDRRVLFVGSHNLTQSALHYNHEASVRIDSPVMAAEALDYLKTLCAGKLLLRQQYIYQGRHTGEIRRYPE